MARNSPILFVPRWKGPLRNHSSPVSIHTPRYSMSPGFPLHAASTDSALGSRVGIFFGVFGFLLGLYEVAGPWEYASSACCLVEKDL